MRAWDLPTPSNEPLDTREQLCERCRREMGSRVVDMTESGIGIMYGRNSRLASIWKKVARYLLPPASVEKATTETHKSSSSTHRDNTPILADQDNCKPHSFGVTPLRESGRVTGKPFASLVEGRAYYLKQGVTFWPDDEITKQARELIKSDVQSKSA